MMISRGAWTRYVNKLSDISDKAANEMLKYIHERGGLESVDRHELIDFAYGVTTKYGEGAAALTAQFYDTIASANKASVPAAVPAETATISEVAKAINGTLKTGNEEIIVNSAGRLVKMAGVDTTMQNALRDGAEWAWIPQGDTCPFCLMLASRDWQPASKKAIKNGHAEHIHANCDCTYAIRFDKNTNVAGYTPKRYLRMYENAKGSTPREKLNSMRKSAMAKTDKPEINVESIVKGKGTPSSAVSLQNRLEEVYERRRTSDNLKMVAYDQIAGKPLNPISVDMAALPDRVQGAFTKTIESLSNRFDTSLMKVRTMTAKETIGNTAFATTTHNYSAGLAELIINPVKCRDYESLVKRIEELQKTGYIPKLKSGSTGDYIATHEFAHTLLNLSQPISSKTNYVGLDLKKIKKAREEIEEIFSGYVAKVAKLESEYKKAEFSIITGESVNIEEVREMKRALDSIRISRYSMTNSDEFMAEAFTDYMLGENPSEYSAQVVSILDKYFGSKP